MFGDYIKCDFSCYVFSKVFYDCFLLPWKVASSSGHNLRKSWQFSVREHGGGSWRRSRQWWINDWSGFDFFDLDYNTIRCKKGLSH